MVALILMTHFIMNESGDWENQTLIPEEKLNRPNAKYWSQKEGYPAYTGRLITEGDKSYFSFSTEDVAFLIAPLEWHATIENPYGFSIVAYEDLIQEMQHKQESNIGIQWNAKTARLLMPGVRRVTSSFMWQSQWRKS